MRLQGLEEFNATRLSHMLPSSLFGFAASLTIGLSIAKATILSEPSNSHLDIVPDGITFHHTHHFPQFPEQLTKRTLPKLGFDAPIADHYVGFRFHRKSGTLLVKPHLSSITSDQIKVQVVGYKKPYEEGLESSSLRSVTGPLIAGTMLSLGRIKDIRILMQNNPFVYLMIDVLVAPRVEIRHARKRPEPISSLSPKDLLTTELPEPPSPPMTRTQVVNSSEITPSEPDSPPMTRTHIVSSSENTPSEPDSPPMTRTHVVTSSENTSSEPDSPPMTRTHIVNSTRSSPSASSSSSSSPFIPDYLSSSIPTLEEARTGDVPQIYVLQQDPFESIPLPKQGTTHVDTSYVSVVLMFLASLPGFLKLIAKVDRADLNRFSSMQSYFKIANESSKPIDWRAFFDVSQPGDPKQFMSELLECLETAFKGTAHYQQLQAIFYGRQHKLLGKMEPFTSLNIIPVGGTLQKSLKQTLHTKASKTILHALPNLLIINTNTMVEKNDSPSKNPARMSFEKRLDISEYVSNPDLDCNYILHAVVVHKGTMQDGHYKIFIMDHFRNRWVRCSGDVLSSVTEFQAMDENFVGDKPACMLGYVKESALATLTGFVPKSFTTSKSQGNGEGGRSNEPLPVHTTSDPSNDSVTSLKVQKGNEQLFEDGISDMVESNDPSSIINIIKQANLVNWSTLTEIYQKGSKANIEEILGEINFSQDDFITAASSHELACLPEKFIGLLGKIKTLGGQESAVKGGIEALFASESIECIAPLKDALEGQGFLKERLEEITIQATFKNGVEKEDEALVRSLYDHPAITSKVYAEVLVISERDSASTPIAQWLLTKADNDDLLAVMEANNDERWSTRFLHAIRDAMCKAKPKGARHSSPSKQTAEIAKETFYEATETSTPPPTKIIGETISAYIIED